MEPPRARDEARRRDGPRAPRSGVAVSSARINREARRSFLERRASRARLDTRAAREAALARLTARAAGVTPEVAELGALRGARVGCLLLQRGDGPADGAVARAGGEAHRA